MSRQSSAKFSIRAKLLLLSMVTLSIPYMGFEYIRELETYLRDALEVSLVDAVKSYAAPLHERSGLFPVHDDNPGHSLYVHEMTHPLQTDGYTDDWKAYLAWSDFYELKNEDEQANPLAYRLIVGHYNKALYVLIRVTDDKLSYRQANRPDSINNDHISLVFKNAREELLRYYFSPTAPGQIRPFRYKTSSDEYGLEYQQTEYATNITGVWQESTDGYILEIEVPTYLITENFGIIVSSNDGDKNITLGTAGNRTADSPGRLLRSSEKIRQIIDSETLPEGRRIWVLNHHGQVLASKGSLDKQFADNKQNLIYSLLLPAVPTRVRDDLAGQSRLQGEEVRQALLGLSETRWRSSPEGKAVIISAATPVRVNGEVRGVMVVEESSSGIQMLQRNAMASLFNKTVLVFFIIVVLILFFASRLSSRIKKLSDQANAAIDDNGRVVGEFSSDRSNDEIGDLSRNYASMLDRLREYSHYMENMADRLSHELRTPIAIVQSSLEQIQDSENSGQADQYLERARQGMERLSMILTRLGEARRLEQAMQSAEYSLTDINELMLSCVAGYRMAYPHQQFNLLSSAQTLTTCLAPDLLVQMLDKLIANAVDFSLKDKAIEIKINSKTDSWQLVVSNFGASLPADMEDQLFNSMVSLRQKKADDTPHLGLGLFIVRLISEYFGGKVRAVNLPGADGVSFIIDLPIKSQTDQMTSQ
ncbi:MAG: proteobacterial dedicated sortase system histidine kinase [Gammaproteobacteria bacterium]|nr:proteobacterial dedicated sortase system histidine kinase [Gammaproteobacteria bacterium]